MLTFALFTTIDELTKKITNRYVNKNIDLLIDDPLRALKVNYNKKNNFWVKNKDRYKTGIDLYIYIDNKINTIINKGQYIAMELETETNYLNIYELKYNNEVMFLQSSYYTNTIKNELGQRIDELQADFNKLNIDISDHDLKTMLRDYNISKINA